MEDNAILDLFWARSDQAIAETQTKYGRMLRAIAYRILKNLEDAEECEADTYLKTWSVIPPQRPNMFSAFLSKITRNLSLDRYDARRAQKRGSGEVPLLLDELAECVPDGGSISDHLESMELTELLNSFLGELKPEARNIFLRRYWFGDSVEEISRESGFGASKIKMSLLRSRKKLKQHLEQEGYAV